MKSKMRIGTRQSRLAMWQANHVAALLGENHIDLEVEIVPIKTLGDRDKSTSLVGLGQSGVFTKEVEQALLDNRCDLAVHSFKDLPTRLGSGLSIGALLKRADPRDALVSRDGLTLDQLPEGATVGTSSLRRRSLLLHLRPDLQMKNLRGNVPTRLEAVGKKIDATVLAYAGLQRLELESKVSEILSPERFLPAPAQGAIAVEMRSNDSSTREYLKPLDNVQTRLATDAERTFLAFMEGGCHVPLGALAQVGENNNLTLAGIVASLDGKKVVQGKMTGIDPVSLGRKLAEDLLGKGAAQILENVKCNTEAR